MKGSERVGLFPLYLSVELRFFHAMSDSLRLSEILSLAVHHLFSVLLLFFFFFWFAFVSLAVKRVASLIRIQCFH